MRVRLVINIGVECGKLSVIVLVHSIACNICGYFDLVSNMLPEIEQPSISGNMLLTRSK